MAALNNPSPGGAPSPSPSPSSATASTRSPVRRARTPRNMNKLPFIRSPRNNNDERMTMERVYKPLTSAPLNGGRNNNSSVSIGVSVSSGPQTCSAVNRRRALHRDPNNMPQLPFDKHAGNQFDNHIRRLERRGTSTDADNGVEHAAGANKGSSNRRLNRRSMHDEMVGMGTSSNSSNSRMNMSSQVSLQPPPPRQPQHQQQVKTIPLQQPPMNIMKPQQKNNNKPINVNINNNNNNKPSSGKADRIILVDEKDKKSFWSSARGKGIDRDLNELDNINNPSHHQRNPSNSNTSIPPIPERRRGQAVGQPTSQQNNANGNNASDNNNNMDMSFGSNSNVSSQPSNESKTSKVSPVCVSQVHIHNLKFSSLAPAKKSSVVNNVSPRHTAKPIRQLPGHQGQVSVGGGVGGGASSTTIKAQPHHPPPPPPRQPGKITPPPPRSKVHDTRKNDVVNKLANNSKFDLPLSSPGGGRCSPNNGSHTTSQIIHDGKLKASSGHVRHVSTPLDNNGVLHPPNKAASHVRQYSAPPPPPSNSASSIPLPKTKLRRASSESSETNRKEVQKNLLYPPPPKNHSVNNNKSPGGAGGIGAIHSPVVTRNTNSTVPGVGGTRGSTSRPPFQDATASTKLATNPNNTTNTDFNKSMSGTLLNEKMASMTIERMMNLPPQVLQRQLNHAQELSALTSSTTKLRHNQPHGSSYQHPVKSVLAQHQQQQQQHQQSGQQQGGKQPQQEQEHSQDQSQRGVRQDYTLGESARSSSHMVIQPNPQAATDAINSLNNHDFAFIKRSDGSYSYAILAYRSNTEEEKRELQQQLQGESIGQVVVSLDKNDTEEGEEEEECMTFVLSNAGCTKLIKKSQWCEYVRLISNKTSSDEFMMSSHGEDTKQEEEVNHTIPPSTTPNDEASPPSNSNTNNNNATKEEEEVKSDHEVEEYLKKLRQEFYATRGPPTVGDGWIPPTTISFDIEDDDISCVSEAIVYSSAQQQQPTPPPHYTNESSIDEIIENGVGATRYKPSQPRILE